MEAIVIGIDGSHVDNRRVESADDTEGRQPRHNWNIIYTGNGIPETGTMITLFYGLW